MFRFEADFRARLLRLRGLLRRAEGATDGGASGRRPGRVDFKDRRPYEPGDDVRFVDWSAYLRSDKLVVKTFTDDEAPEAHVVLDRSASCGPEGSRQDRTTRELAAAVGFLALSRGGRAHLVFIGGNDPQKTIEARGRTGSEIWLRAIENAAPPFGAADFAASAKLRFPRRPGVVAAIVSDFLAPEFSPDVLSAVGAAGNAAAFVVLAHDEVSSATDSGATTLSDPESGARLVVSDDAAWRAAYAEERAAHVAEISRIASSRGVRCVAASGRERFEDLVTRSGTGAP